MACRTGAPAIWPTARCPTSRPLEWFYAHTVGNLIAAVLVPAASLVVLASGRPAAGAGAGAGQIPFAAYPPAIVLAGYAFIPLLEVSVPLRMLGQIRASAIRVHAITDVPANVEDTGRVEVLPAAPLDVRLDAVTFRYRRFRRTSTCSTTPCEPTSNSAGSMPPTPKWAPQ